MGTYVDPQVRETLLAAPKRRDVAAITTVLAAAAEGDLLSVLYRTERYGVVRVIGQACRSAAYEGLVVGREPLGTPKPGPGIVGLTNLGTGEDATKRLAILTDAVENWAYARGVARPCDIEPGTLVALSLKTPAWGHIEVYGHVVRLGEHTLAVGGWILAYQDQPGSLVSRVCVLDPTLAHEAAPGPASLAGAA